MRMKSDDRRAYYQGVESRRGKEAMKALVARVNEEAVKAGIIKERKRK